MLIPKDIKSSDFVCVDSGWVAGAFFVSVDSRGVSGAALRLAELAQDAHPGRMRKA